MEGRAGVAERVPIVPLATQVSDNLRRVIATACSSQSHPMKRRFPSCFTATASTSTYISQCPTSPKNASFSSRVYGDTSADSWLPR
jgi:hypothetical protein